MARGCPKGTQMDLPTEGRRWRGPGVGGAYLPPPWMMADSQQQPQGRWGRCLLSPWHAGALAVARTLPAAGCGPRAGAAWPRWWGSGSCAALWSCSGRSHPAGTHTARVTTAQTHTRHGSHAARVIRPRKTHGTGHTQHSARFFCLLEPTWQPSLLEGMASSLCPVDRYRTKAWPPAGSLLPNHRKRVRGDTSLAQLSAALPGVPCLVPGREASSPEVSGWKEAWSLCGHVPISSRPAWKVPRATRETRSTTEMEGEGAWHRHGWLRNVPCDLMFL